MFAWEINFRHCRLTLCWPFITKFYVRIIECVFTPFLQIEVTRVAEIPPYGAQFSIHFTLSVLWLPIHWSHINQHQWHWLGVPRITLLEMTAWPYTHLFFTIPCHMHKSLMPNFIASMGDWYGKSVFNGQYLISTVQYISTFEINDATFQIQASAM